MIGEPGFPRVRANYTSVMFVLWNKRVWSKEKASQIMNVNEGVA
jgi:hypothetical protein